MNRFLRNTGLCILLFIYASVANAQREYLVSVDPISASISRIDSIPGVRYLQSYAAYNQTTKEYTVIATWQPGQTPSRLYTIDVTSGNILYSPIVPNPNSIIRFQYSRLTGLLYGVVSLDGMLYLAVIDETTGLYFLIHEIPGIVGVNGIAINEIDQLLYLNAGTTILVIDLASGITLSSVPIPRLLSMQYDNNTQKLYGLTSRPGPLPGTDILSMSSVEPFSGTVSNISDLPTVKGVISGPYEAFNENDHTYYFGGQEQNPGVFYYSVDVTSGVILNSVLVPNAGNNLILFNYDNLFNKLYALFWESAVVPITLDRFNASLKDKSVLCTWHTMQESNSDHFVIERSVDGKSFKEVGKLPAAGNSFVPRDYNFPDAGASFVDADNLFYRLKMVDFDGRFAYSQVARVSLNADAALNIFPNPAIADITVRYNSLLNENAYFLITDQSGRKIYKQSVSIKKGANFLPLDVSFLEQGTYILSLNGKERRFGQLVKTSR